MDAYTRPICSLAKSLGTIGVAERGRYVWHEDEKYVRFLAEFFLRRSNRTTVQRFLPSFIEAFPTFEALASAEPDSVVKVAWWAGLRRRVAKLPVIAATFLSRETWTAEELLSLPHVGRYAAEGIALYVLGEPTFPVDNNVRRVVGRYLGIDSEAGLGEAVRALVDIALRQGDFENLRDVHRGALALGWESCRTKPACGTCSLRDSCAYGSGVAE